jgi:sugar/nucleoside kinase (ribokinase family)
MLKTAGVDLSGVVVVPGASGTFVFPTDGAKPWPMYRPAEAFPGHAPVVLDARVYALFGMPDCDPVALGWLEHIPEHATLVWDRQGWISRARNAQAPGRLSPHRKIYLANRDEAIAEFSTEVGNDLWDKLPPPNYQAAVIKRGKDGCTVVDEEEATDIRGFPVEVATTIGAGDAFAGAFAADLARGANVRRAALTGNALASVFLKAQGDPLIEGLLEEAHALVER